MRDRDLYARILNLSAPWSVRDVELDLKAEEVRVIVEAAADAELVCPTCGRVCGRYDRRERRWRHLDTCQLRTVLVAQVPRVSCPEHGVHQVAVPWADPGSAFTALFEALVIDWLKEASIQAVAKRMGLSWDEADGIQGRAVARGLARGAHQAPTRIGVDETSFQKRHEYLLPWSRTRTRGRWFTWRTTASRRRWRRFLARTVRRSGRRSSWWRWTCGGRTSLR